MTEPARMRRSRHEVHRLILDAARLVFAEKGFGGATTKEIAERAGVHETMVYRRFASKAELYEAAVLVPFSEVIAQYLETQQKQLEQPASFEGLVRAFIEPLYELLVGNHDLALALVAGHGVGPEFSSEGESPLIRLLSTMEPQLKLEAARRGLRVDAPGTVLASVGMVLGVALLEANVVAHRPDWISHHRLIEEIVTLVVLGTTPRETAPEGSGAFSLLLERAIDAERRVAVLEQELASLRAELSADPRRADD